MITGGAGFIGSEVVRQYISETDVTVVNVDKLTYAGNLESLQAVAGNSRYHFEQVDICDAAEVKRLFEQYQPNAVLHLAAESHVDRSIDGPAKFIHTNIIGTYTLLEAARNYWNELTSEAKQAFRFHHISTDEVYGSLNEVGVFTEESPYAPNSPYSASKASADHLVRAWHHTYGLPVVTSFSVNNFGPYQYPEKLIPLTILNALDGKAIPVYGDGSQVREWLPVSEHARALRLILQKGQPGEVYNIGGNAECTNYELVESICELLDEIVAQHPAGVTSFKQLISFVPDRPGHDQRYALDAGKLQRELGWLPQQSLESALRNTVQWYVENHDTYRHIHSISELPPIDLACECA